MKKKFNDADLPSLLADPSTKRAAFTQLMETYQRSVYWQIRRMVQSHDDADDILQNTFIKAWTNIEKFRGDSSLSTWLYRIAVNETLNFLSSSHQKQAANTSDLDSPAGLSVSGDIYFDGDEAQRKLQNAIAQLPEKQRIVFNLRYYDEMPYNQMSEVLGTSEGALKASYHHAVKKIEEFLKLPD